MKDSRMTVKSRLLEILEQHKGEVLSGEHLAQELNCTRAAIWKGVKSLREEGHRIQAGPNKGYMLEADSNRLSVEGLKLYLDHPDVMVRLYDSVPSTNQAAKLAAVSGDAGHGSLVAALEQTEGRGRRGRSFCSPREAGLYFSVVLHPGEFLQESLLITTAAAVAVYKAVLEVCGISLGIKWVNDLFKDGKKVCGILTEAMTDFESGNIEFAIVGIGLNLFPGEEIPEELENIAGALYDTEEEAGRADRNRLMAQIVNHLLKETEDLSLSQVYIQQNFILGREIQIQDSGNLRKATAMAICPDGRLLVKEADGSESKLSYGEVSVVLPEG